MLDRLFGRKRQLPAAGDLYASREPDGSVSVMKILAVDPDAISIRINSNRFADPESVDLDALELVGLGPDFVERQARGENPEIPANLGIGHLPIDPSGFDRRHLMLLGNRPVEEAELEGYRYWRDEAEGGVFA